VPQLLPLVVVSTHCWLHIVWPPGQRHALAVHDDPPGQAEAQEPQWLLSLVRSTHALKQRVDVGAVHARPHAFTPQVGLPVPAAGPGHVVHAAPPVPVPHSVGLWLVVTHPVASQQPLAHDAALHATQAPLWQIAPAAHGRSSRTLFTLTHAGPEEHD